MNINNNTRNMNQTGRLNYVDKGLDDMTNLVELSDESLLSNLEARYNQNIIYTYIGSILISINPYQELGIYDEKRIAAYRGRTLSEMPPHIFGIGEVNYQKMIRDNENQVIVISGESGAGKTEAFKRILKYLAHSSGGMKDKGSFSTSVAKKVLDSTPLLESFGNAKTIRNDNSSRFGKYVEVFFENGKISGSRITNYLLEKSRIVRINPDERGYHIFYEILKGLDSYSKSQYYLKDVNDYKYLNKSKNLSVEGKNDATSLSDFMEQWNTLGLTSDDLDVTLRIISAVLHLGNIEFMEEEEESYLSEMENVKVVAKMLKIDLESLKNCLTMKTTETVRESAISPVNMEQAQNFTDTLAKHLYTELFNWIIGKVNESLTNNESTVKRSASKLDKSLNSNTSKFRSIAMLDIYGFENFPENSLEQLCINFANETLQQFFNRYVFELEQAEYRQEGISWHYITYPDNQPIIDLLSAKPSGIIQILNDECSIPQGSDESFLMKCHNVHQKNAHFEKPKSQYPPKFIIHHFAGNIAYNVSGFLEKNRDILRKEMMSMIEHCQLTEVANMFKSKIAHLTKNPLTKARTPAVMADFQVSLGLLLNKMKQSEPWFIRCLKPNNKKLPTAFNQEIVMDQMRYTGILETVKIRKSGFPIRILFTVFLSRFYLLQNTKDKNRARSDPKEVSSYMMKRFGGQKGDHFEVGKTKLFLRERFARHLECQVRVIQDQSARIIQKKWRAYWKIRVIEKMNNAATLLQAIARGFIERRRIKKMHISIVKLQSFVRMQLTRKKFLEAHPEFLKYVKEKEEEGGITKSSIHYNFPKVEPPVTAKQPRKPKVRQRRFNYEALKIPKELAFLLDKSKVNYGEDHILPKEKSIIQIGRTQHLWNKDEVKLPEDIDEYSLVYFMNDDGNDMKIESKPKPITAPFLITSLESDELREEALNAHKLILRLLYVQSMPWQYHYLSGSYLQYMASKSDEIQKEIIIQILAETIPSGAVGKGPKDITSKLELRRIRVAWTLLGNILSHIILPADIFKYVLKYVSDSYGWDQAVTCQEKLLQTMASSHKAPVIPRLFPVSNLEWRANTRGSKTSLKICHADNNSNIVHVSSFSDAESVACQSLCFRLNRYKLLKGWTISIIQPDMVIDCGGQNYIFDAISAIELPQVWQDITGQSLESNFLVSKRTEQSSHAHNRNQYTPRQCYAHNTPRIKKKDVPSISNPREIEKWLNHMFDNDEISNHSVNMMIHGLEDGLPANKLPNSMIPGHRSTSTTLQNNVSMDPNAQSNISYQLPRQPYYQGTVNPQARALEDQLNYVQLENRLIQSNIEKQLLQNQYQQIQQSQFPNGAVAQPFYNTPQHFDNSYNYSNMSDSSFTQQEPIKRQAPQPPIPINNRRDDMEYKPTPTPESTKTFSQKEVNRKRSIVKYSEINGPSTIVVDDSTILPIIEEKPNKSHLRATEVPKVNVANRAAILEKFFKDKDGPLQKSSAPKMKPQAPAAPKSPILNNLSHPEFEPPPPPPPAPPKRKSTDRKIERRDTIIPRPHIDSIGVATSRNVMLDFEDQKPDVTVISQLPRSPSPQKPDATVITQLPRSASPQKRRLPTENKALLLSGIADIRYFTYNNVGWHVQLRKEIYLLTDIQDSTMLSTMVFCQIFDDIIHQPCIRWIGREKENIRLLLGEYAEAKNLNDLLTAPKQLMLQVINEAQNSELYFSRFYAIELEPNCQTPKSIQIWAAISHSGLRLVEQLLTGTKSNSLKLINKHPFKTLKNTKVKHRHNENYQMVTIKTTSNKIKFFTKYGESIKNLIDDFRMQTEFSTIGTSVGSLFNLNSDSVEDVAKPRKRRKNLKESVFASETESVMMTYGVNKERIPMSKSQNKHLLRPAHEPSSITAEINVGGTISRGGIDRHSNLTDFVTQYSKHKDKRTVIQSILLYQNEPISEPILPYINEIHFEKAKQIYKVLLSICHTSDEQEESIIHKYAEQILKTAQDNKELIEEIILQVFKQINGNPNKNSSEKLWYVLDLLLLFVGPSKRLQPYLQNQLKQIMHNNQYSCQHLAVHSMKYLKSFCRFGPRKVKPISQEMEFIMKGVRNAQYTIMIPKSSVEIIIHFNTTITGAISSVCHFMGLTSAFELAEYSLAVWHENETVPEMKNSNINKHHTQQNSDMIINKVDYLQPDEYMYDVINNLIHSNHTSCTFYFNRTSWLTPLAVESRSEPFINLTFNQLSQDVATGLHMLPKRIRHLTADEMQNILKIALLNYRGQGLTVPASPELVHQLLPHSIIYNNSFRMDEFCSQLNSLINSESSLAETVIYQRSFLEKVERLPHFGFLRFPIANVNGSKSEEQQYFTFSRRTFLIADSDYKVILLGAPFNEIVDFNAVLENVSETSNMRFKFTLNFVNNHKVSFLTDKTSEMIFLLNHYRSLKHMV